MNNNRAEARIESGAKIVRTALTLEQLRIFVAVAEREHVTRAAEALHLTQSAASGAIAALEARNDVRLFHRVGRRIELTDAGRVLLGEARAVLARARDAELALSEISELRRGRLRLVASQTIAGYWLPERLVAFHRHHPLIELDVAIANTQTAARMVSDGDAELGFIEGRIDQPALAVWEIATDRMILVGQQTVDCVTNDWLLNASWIMREPGSGTRSTFKRAIRDRGIDFRDLKVALTLPSNESVLAAAKSGVGHAVLSQRVVAPAIDSGILAALPFDLPMRPFYGLRQKERYRSKAADALLSTIRGHGDTRTT